MDSQERSLIGTAAKPSESYTWRSILRGREVLESGLGINIRNGKSSNFCLNQWLPCGPLIQHATRTIEETESEN